MTNGVIAGIYRDMGESTLAKKHYQIAIELNRQTQDAKTLAWYYQGLGETYKKDSSYDDAIESFSKAYLIYKKEHVSSNLLVYLLQLLADTYALKQDEKKFYKTRENFLTSSRHQDDEEPAGLRIVPHIWGLSPSEKKLRLSACLLSERVNSIYPFVSR